MSELPAISKNRFHYPADDWWVANRRRYNITLMTAGFVAIIGVAILAEYCPHLEIEISLFTIPFQLIGCALGIALANLCYQLGPWGEQILAPNDLGRYRRTTFR